MCGPRGFFRKSAVFFTDTNTEIEEHILEKDYKQAFKLLNDTNIAVRCFEKNVCIDPRP